MTLREKLLKMSRQDLERLACRIVNRMYATAEGGGIATSFRYDRNNEWSSETIEEVAQALNEVGLIPDTGEKMLDSSLVTVEETPATENMIALAREEYEEDAGDARQIQIDDGALMSDARPEGVWVAAWVWLGNEILGPDKEN